MRLLRALHSARDACVVSTPPPPEAPAGLFARLAGHVSSRPAVTHGGRTETYAKLLTQSARTALALRALDLPASHGAAARIGLLRLPGHGWVHGLLGTWGAGLVAVPLSPNYPAGALAPLLADAGATATLAGSGIDLPSGIRRLCCDGVEQEPPDLPGDAEDEAPRMLLYTSGTTGTPKGVVWDGGMLHATLGALHSAWNWRADDRALCVLPLHHVHGVVNVALGALYAGAELEFHDRFDAIAVWDAFAGPSPPSVFMAVPTVYARLVDCFRAAGPGRQAELRAAARRVRLFVSGSAALPRQTGEIWGDIAGAIPLERYGMTETGMLLSNPYVEEDRVPAALGSPLPGVSARVDETGMLAVKGPSVFKQYWWKPEATQNAFDEQGWFITGDIMRYDHEEEMFRMLGRASVDVIKTGGYKVSALEVEAAVRDVQGVRDVAVIGVPHSDLGEAIVALTIADEGVQGEAVRCSVMQHLPDVLPRYKVPRAMHFVESFPRNAMGKVQKTEMKKAWADWYTAHGWADRAIGG